MEARSRYPQKIRFKKCIPGFKVIFRKYVLLTLSSGPGLIAPIIALEPPRVTVRVVHQLVNLTIKIFLLFRMIRWKFTVLNESLYYPFNISSGDGNCHTAKIPRARANRSGKNDSK